MINYPGNISDLERHFGNDYACREHLFGIRWPDGVRCPRCYTEKFLDLGGGVMQCKSCKYRWTVTAGTIFEGTRKPLNLWFKAIWWAACQNSGTSATGLQRVLGLGSYETSWSWLHKIRKTMSAGECEKLHGRIEVDELSLNEYISFGNRHKRNKSLLVLIAVQLNDNVIERIRMRRIQEKSISGIHRVLAEIAEKGSYIITDSWKGYSSLKDRGFEHDIIRDDYYVGHRLLPHCQKVGTLLKRWLYGTHQGTISNEHIDCYLDEFTFRFNRRNIRNKGYLFNELLKNAVTASPLPYSNIKKGIRGLMKKE